MKKTISLFFVGLYQFSALHGTAQYTDTLILPAAVDTTARIINWNAPTVKRVFPYRQFFVPAVMVAYGITSLKAGGLKSVNDKIKEEVYTERGNKNAVHIDNYLLYAPAAAVY